MSAPSPPLAQEGAQVLVTDVDLAAAETTVADLRGRRLAAEAFRCDAAPYRMASVMPSHSRDLASSATTAVSTACCHRTSSPPHRSATIAMAIGVCSSPSTSMCRAR